MNNSDIAVCGIEDNGNTADPNQPLYQPPKTETRSVGNNNGVQATTVAVRGVRSPFKNLSKGYNA
jgi:hypothetical protein